MLILDQLRYMSQSLIIPEQIRFLCYALAELLLAIVCKCKDHILRRLLANTLDRNPAAQPVVKILMARHSARQDYINKL